MKHEKLKIGDVYLIPAGTKLSFINLQQQLITTKKYVIKVTNTVTSDDVSFFGDLYEILFESFIPSLLKIPHGYTFSNLDIAEPIGDLLKPNIINIGIQY